jgi:hypothetical protein
MKKKLQIFAANVAGEARHETLEGRSYRAVPMVMAVEGVLDGSTGPMFYPGEELGKIPASWNHKPVTVYHPSASGDWKSACDPLILETQKVGIIMNASYADGKLKAEAWLDMDRAEQVDNRVTEAIDNKTMMELSTGLWSDVDESSGVWNEKEYDKIARNIVPDHLAILPDQQGACSISDGAGFFRANRKGGGNNEVDQVYKRLFLFENAASHEEVRDQLQSELNANLSSDARYRWIERVYDTYVIYEDGDSLFKLNYQSADDQVSLSGEPVEVVRVVEYRLKDGGTIVSNKSNGKDTDMKKETLVNNLIESDTAKWGEKDREFLMTCNEEHLKKMAPTPADEAPAETPDETPENTPTQNEETTPENTPSAPQAMTANQYVENAPPEIRDMLISGLHVHNKQKADHIAVILANESNKFTKEYLQTLNFGELAGIAVIAAKPAEKAPPPMFGGRGEVETMTIDNKLDEDPLEMPELFPVKE